MPTGCVLQEEALKSLHFPDDIQGRDCLGTQSARNSSTGSIEVADLTNSSCQVMCLDNATYAPSVMCSSDAISPKQVFQKRGILLRAIVPESIPQHKDFQHQQQAASI